jgi:hypothetical protein
MGFYKAKDIVRHPDDYAAKDVREAAVTLDRDEFATREDWSYSTVALQLLDLRPAVQ